jgi:hypothetical protein
MRIRLIGGRPQRPVRPTLADANGTKYGCCFFREEKRAAPSPFPTFGEANYSCEEPASGASPRSASARSREE